MFISQPEVLSLFNEFKILQLKTSSYKSQLPLQVLKCCGFFQRAAFAVRTRGQGYLRLCFLSLRVIFRYNFTLKPPRFFSEKTCELVAFAKQFRE